MNPDIDPEIGNEISIINLSCLFNTLFGREQNTWESDNFEKLKMENFPKFFLLNF